MTRTTKRLPLLAAGLVTSALILGVSGIATAHTPASDTHARASMHGGHMGAGMQGGHMSKMMGSHMSGMMGALDDEAMADLRAQMSELHDQMLELHMQAQADDGTPTTEEVALVEDAEVPPPEES